MISTSGAKLVSDEAIDIYKNQLLPMCTLMTPNIDEACVLLQNDHSTDIVIDQYNQLQMAHQLQQKYGCAVLLRGTFGRASNRYFGRTRWHRNTNAACPLEQHLFSWNGMFSKCSDHSWIGKGWSVQKSVQEGLHFVQSALQQPCQVKITGEEESIDC